MKKIKKIDNKHIVENLVNSPIKKLDNNGVLIYKIPYTNTWDYYPIHIGNFALANLKKYYESNKEVYKDVFFYQLNWLYQNLTEKSDFAVLEHFFKVPFYDFKNVPWVHGLAQGHLLSVLVKAYELTKEKKYLITAEKVYNSFETDIQEGGARFKDNSGNIWLEEYALLPPPHVLNGFITILFSINNFYSITDNSKAKKMWEEGIKTIKKHLQKYDVGYWSLYNLIHMIPSTEKYHNMHVRQLKQLYKMTGDIFFKNYANRWESYSNKTANRYRAKINRGFNHLRRFGTVNSVKRYYLHRKWMKMEG